MIDILEFVQPETVFDPETIQVLASAFDDAWDRLQKSGSRFARPGYSRAMREVIARHIIEMAQQGVTDPRTLAENRCGLLVPITKTTAAARSSRGIDPWAGAEWNSRRCGVLGMEESANGLDGS